MTDSGISQDAVVIERTFDAPVHLIWLLWTFSEHFKAWLDRRARRFPSIKWMCT
jgi:uncharacterized protein YndB with AHSA1/START domain